MKLTPTVALYLALLIILATVAELTAFAQGGERISPNRISVKVEGDETLKGDVASYIKRELRGLNDFVVTDERPHLNIEILVMRLTNRGDVARGYALSVVVTELFGEQFVDVAAPEVCADCLISSWGRGLKGVLPYLVTLEYHSIFTGGLDDLQSLCRDAVATIDTKVFDPRRTATQKAKDRAKKP